METLKLINDIIYELSGVEKIDPNDELKRDIGLDSLGLVTLLIRLEEKFGIELDESDLNPLELTNVFDIVGIVKKHQVSANEEES